MQTLQATPGETIHNLTLRGIHNAKAWNKEIAIKHNDITITVYPESYVEDVYEKWSLLCKIVSLTNERGE